MLRYLVYIAIASVTLGIGFISPYVLSPQIEDVKVKGPQHGGKGFDEVLYGKEGSEVTVIGFLDTNGKCMNVSETQHDICTTAVGTLDKFVEVTLRVCNEQLRKNCIVERIPGQDSRLSWMFVYDNNSNLIPVDGMRIYEEPNSWISDPVLQLRLTGTISEIDGRGYLITPIKCIESVH